MENIDRLEELYLKKLEGTATPDELDEFDRLSTGEEEPAPSPRDAKKAQYVQSLAQLATATGISQRTLRIWKSRPGFPAKTSKGYHVEKVRQFIETSRTDNANRTQTPEERQERALLLRARRMREEINVAKARGELVPASAACEVVSGIFARLKGYTMRSLESDPTKLAKMGTVEDIRDHLRKIFNDLFAEGNRFIEEQTRILKNGK